MATDVFANLSWNNTFRAAVNTELASEAIFAQPSAVIGFGGAASAIGCSGDDLESMVYGAEVSTAGLRHKHMCV